MSSLDVKPENYCMRCYDTQRMGGWNLTQLFLPESSIIYLNRYTLTLLISDSIYVPDQLVIHRGVEVTQPLQISATYTIYSKLASGTFGSVILWGRKINSSSSSYKNCWSIHGKDRFVQCNKNSKRSSSSPKNSIASEYHCIHRLGRSISKALDCRVWISRIRPR